MNKNSEYFNTGESFFELKRKKNEKILKKEKPEIVTNLLDFENIKKSSIEASIIEIKNNENIEILYKDVNSESISINKLSTFFFKANKSPNSEIVNKISLSFNSTSIKINSLNRKLQIINTVNCIEKDIVSGKKNKKINFGRLNSKSLFSKEQTYIKRNINPNKESTPSKKICFNHISSKVKIKELKNLEKSYIAFFFTGIYENIIACPGTVFLFGRKALPGSLETQSCVIKINNILRSLYVLPSQNRLGRYSFEKVSEELITIFKPKKIKIQTEKVKRKYCFLHRSEVPFETEYVNLRYGFDSVK